MDDLGSSGRRQGPADYRGPFKRHPEVMTFKEKKKKKKVNT